MLYAFAKFAHVTPAVPSEIEHGHMSAAPAE